MKPLPWPSSILCSNSGGNLKPNILSKYGSSCILESPGKDLFRIILWVSIVTTEGPDFSIALVIKD